MGWQNTSKFDIVRCSNEKSVSLQELVWSSVMGEQDSLGYVDNMVLCTRQRLEILPYCGSSLHGDSLKTSQLKKCTQKNLHIVAKKNMAE